MAKSSKMKAVILNGGRGSAILPLANHHPKVLFPVINEPLIVHTIRALIEQDITDIAIVSSPTQDLDKDKIRNYIQKVDRNVSIHHFLEFTPKGTAGALSNLKDFIGSSNVVVLQGNLYLRETALPKLVAAHIHKHSGMTVAIEQANKDVLNIENIGIDGQGQIHHYHVMHKSLDKRKNAKSSGIFVLSPDILCHIPQDRYMDMKEQLIPALIKAKVPVHAHDIGQSVIAITTTNDYINLNKELLHVGIISRNMQEKLEGVTVGVNANISSRANIIGPVVIGDNCVIKDYAQIIGPVVIGNDSTIGKEALVKDSILWENVVVKNKGRVEYSLIGDHQTINENDYLLKMVYAKNEFSFDLRTSCQKEAPGPNWPMVPEGNPVPRILNSVAKKRIYLKIKAITDILAATLFLFLFLPVLLLVAALIKLTSPGPVLYCQARCSKNGRQFKMYKFRTMVIDADKAQDALAGQNAVDGPMFKMDEDPRVTKLGRFLRKTSLDELPQLYNVLRGEMSIVGPRPLRMEEMAFCPSWRDMRLLVTPGITGLWQVRKKDNETFSEWIQSDIEYVLNQSFLLDMKIILKTFRAAYQKKIFNTQENYENTINLSRS